MPEASSLVAWLNSIGSGGIDTLADLKTGRYLLICLSTLDPECETEIDSDDYWQALLDYLSKSYECDVKRCVDLCKLEEGDEEHIGRITVLLLCHAVHCSAREAIISTITELDTGVQGDIKDFIENGLAAISSHALEAGMFQSGIDHGIDKSSSVAVATPIQQPTIVQQQLQFSPVSSNMPNPLVFCTPASVRLPRRQTRTIVDTPAALHWLGSPSSSVYSNQSSASETLRQVEFKLSISEKALAQERQLCEELSSELAYKISQVDKLGFEHKSELLARQKDHEQAMRDLEDELVHLRQRIVSFESNETKLHRQLASLKEDHNKKLEDGIQHEKLQQEQVDQLSSLMTEQAAQLQLVGVRLQAAEAEVHTKSEVISKLESCQEEHEATRQSLLSKQQLLESTLRTEVEEMRTAIETLTTDLASYQTKYSESQQALQQCRENHTAQLTVVQETHKSELASLKEQLGSAQSANTELQQLLDEARETASEKEKTQHQEFTAVVDEQKALIQQLEENLTEVKRSGDEAMQQCQEEHTEQLASLQETHKSEIASLKEQLGSAQSANTELQELLDQASEKLETTTEKERTQHQEFTAVVDEQKALIQQLEENLREVKNSSDEAMQQCQEEHTEQLATLQETHKSEIASLKKQLESAQSANIELQELLDQAREKLETTTEKERTQHQEFTAVVDEQQAQIQRLEEKLAEVKKSGDEAMQQCQEEHIAQLASLQETHSAVLESELASLKEQLESVQSANAELQQLLDQAREKLETTTGTQHQEFTAIVTEQKALIQQLEEKLAEVKKCNAEAMQQCQEEHSEQLEMAQSAKTELQQLLDQTTQKLKELKEKHNLEQQNVVELTTIVNQQKMQTQTLQERLNDLKMSNEKKSQVISKLEYCQEEHEAARQFLVSEQQRLESTHKTEMEEMTTAMDTLKTKYEETKQALLQKRTAQLSEIRDQNQSSAAMLDMYSSKMSELSIQISNFEEENRLLAKELEKAKAEHNRYVLQVQEADSRYNLLDEEYQRVCKDKAKTDTKLLRLTAENQSLETQLDYASHQLREIGKSSRSSPSRSRPVSSRKNTRSSPRLLTAPAVIKDEDEDPHERVSELQWRNAQRLPHLRSSYPVEMQVQPEIPSISDESVKYLQPSSTSHSISHETSPSSSRSSVIGQKRSVDNRPLDTDVLVFSPVKKSTTCQLALKRTRVTSAHTNAGSGLQLRSYLDSGSSSPNKNPGRENSTAFEVNFSPPKKRTKMPTRLREKESRPLTSSKQTITKKPPPTAAVKHTTTKTRRGASALKSVNN